MGSRLIFWTGERHCGKTAAAANLVQIAQAEGFNVAGLLAPSVYRNGKLEGFDAFDLASNKRAHLAVCDKADTASPMFKFVADGVTLGKNALSPAATESAELVIVDEFGRLELEGRLWRKDVDALLASTDALVVLVVRRELLAKVRHIYRSIPSEEVTATDSASVEKVMSLLRARRRVLCDEMIRLGGMLLIGSAGPNVGKTALACALLRRFAPRTKIIGVKVTTIKAKDGRCPRGGRGCGVCTSLEGDFCITEEKDAGSKKDTSRLLAAGAARVFWLRVLKNRLREGFKAMLEIIGCNSVLVCESNSLRRVVEPGLFLMVQEADSNSWKSTACEVKKYADKIVVSDGDSFDFDLERIKPVDGKWKIMEKATAIIMAGGKSSRMGADKCMLSIDGKAMIERVAEQLRGSFEQILVSSNEPDKLNFLGLPVVCDRIAEQGPLMGIASTLAASENELNFVVACDIPNVHLYLVRRMLCEAQSADIVVPVSGGEHYEPLFAVYRRSILPAVNELLSEGNKKISDLFGRCKVSYIRLDAGAIDNVNTMVDYKGFLKKYSRRL